VFGTTRDGIVASDRDYGFPEGFHQSGLYHDVYRPLDVLHNAAFKITDERRNVWVLAIERPGARPQYDHETLLLYAEVGAHFRRALALWQRLEGGTGELRTLRHACDGLGDAALVLARDGRILEANQTAAQLLARKDGVRAVNGVLRANFADDQRRLERLLWEGATVSTRSDLPGPGGSLPIRRGDGKAPLQAVLTPIALASTAPRNSGAHAVLLITVPERRQGVRPEDIARHFGLTPREARFAALLAEGHTPRAAGEAMDLTYQSARTYVRRVMSKMDVSRQSDVVRLVGSLHR
jgi:DNA-binding CsgD family transcriptional regulator